MNKLRVGMTATAVLLLSLLSTPAQAANGFAATLDKSTALVAAGDTIKVTMANVPAGAGMYVQQCAASTTAGVRPTNCNGRGIWVTSTVAAGTPGTAAPGSVISLPVSASFTTAAGTSINCMSTQCGVFTRRDHFATADTSLDSFTAIAFIGDSIARPKDVITAAAGGTPVSTRTPLTLRYRTPVALNITSTSGTPVALTSLSPNCVVTGTTVTAVKATGECAFMATTIGSGAYAAGQEILPAYLASAQQIVKLAIPAKAKTATFVALGKTTLRTSMSQPVTWKSLTSGCVVSNRNGNVALVSYKARTCQVLAYAPSRADL